MSRVPFYPGVGSGGYFVRRPAGLRAWLLDDPSWVRVESHRLHTPFWAYRKSFQYRGLFT